LTYEVTELVHAKGVGNISAGVVLVDVGNVLVEDGGTDSLLRLER
jgi:hypothetical protein